MRNEIGDSRYRQRYNRWMCKKGDKGEGTKSGGGSEKPRNTKRDNLRHLVECGWDWKHYFHLFHVSRLSIALVWLPYLSHWSHCRSFSLFSIPYVSFSDFSVQVLNSKTIYLEDSSQIDFEYVTLWMLEWFIYMRRKCTYITYCFRFLCYLLIRQSVHVCPAIYGICIGMPVHKT